jgi:preprotein translocase subunit SecB
MPTFGSLLIQQQDTQIDTQIDTQQQQIDTQHFEQNIHLQINYIQQHKMKMKIDIHNHYHIHTAEIILGHLIEFSKGLWNLTLPDIWLAI